MVRFRGCYICNFFLGMVAIMLLVCNGQPTKPATPTAVVSKQAPTEIADSDMVARRRALLDAPATTLHVLLLNDSGVPVYRATVSGKIAHSSENSPYIYFWTDSGQYVQWSGHYLYSNKQFNTRIEPLVVVDK